MIEPDQGALHHVETDKASANRWKGLVFLAAVVITYALIVIQISVRRTSYTVQVGDVATQDILSPRTITYESKILTEQAQADAERIVDKVYLPADPTISRNQVQFMRNSFRFISAVRLDKYASENQKIEDIEKLAYVQLEKTVITELLGLVEEDWNSVQNESQRILEQIMQNSIREDQLQNEILNIPTMINYYIKSDLSQLINNLTRRFITPNSLYSEELTEKSIADARSAVQPRERTFVTNQTIVSRGQIITDLIYEALDKLGLVYTRNTTQRLLSAAFIVLALALFALTYFISEDRFTRLSFQETLLIIGLYLVFLIAARILIPNRTIVPFLFPMTAVGLTIAGLCGSMYGMIISLILGMIVPFDFNDALGYTIYYIVAGISGIIVLGKGRQIADFVVAGVVSGLIGIPIILFFQLNEGNFVDITGLVTLATCSIISGVLSTAIALILQYSLGGMIGVATPMQLLEIIRPDSPLLQFILNNAPGTYQHSLQVANLAEQAAKAVGADPLLIRAGTMYHDAGKALNPEFFIENQVGDTINTHEDLSPTESAHLIIRHVPDGVKLIRQHRLPAILENFVLEHHGTNCTRYMYNQAVNAAPPGTVVDIKDFSYPGPTPRSKETAILMLADTTEARARAEKPKNIDEINAMIKSVFDYYTTNGQMDNAPLTLNDMTKIREAFAAVLINTYHPRVKYPEIKRNRAAEAQEDKPISESAETAEVKIAEIIAEAPK